jgi:hypothetical protein
MRALTADRERDFVHAALAGYGYRGKGVLEKGDTQGLGDTYDYTVRFEIENFLRSGRSGAFVFFPVIGSPLPVTSFANAEDRPDQHRRSLCTGFDSAETYRIEFPATLKLLAMPDDAKLRGSLLDFTASYREDGHAVVVTREVHDKTPDAICSPEEMAEFLRQARPIGQNLRTQVLYQRKPS